jgi:cysteine-rich repeat protein
MMTTPTIGSASSNLFSDLRIALVVAILASLPLPVSASDGIHEINQASALAGGGFPVVLASPGSYRLTGNLDLSLAPIGTTAISVTAEDVYLDLGGFSIRGPLNCTTVAPPVAAGSGVTSSAAGTTVANGTVRGFGANGLQLSEQARVTSVQIHCNGAIGLRAGREARIESSSIRLSAVGVETDANALLIDNEITRNAGFGLIGGALTALRGNVFAENNGGDANAQINAVAGVLELGANRCGTSLTCVSGGLCGNGVPEAGEGCDDDNATSGDGCSSTCSVEPSYFCSGAPSVCVPSVCGNGQTESGESCDQGNVVSGDGCSGICTIEPGYTCSGQPSICTSECGDGIIAGSESCDQGNVVSGDGCSAACTVEPGFACFGQPSVCMPL